MGAIKYSRQREAIRQNLLSRKDHPTAEMIYESVKHEYPHISLGTIYRNLSLLVEQGEVVRLAVGDSDRFDMMAVPHFHFVCRKCGRVTDLYPKREISWEEVLGNDFDGRIEEQLTFFRGICRDCGEQEPDRPEKTGSSANDRKDF